MTKVIDIELFVLPVVLCEGSWSILAKKEERLRVFGN
jgi:hypothetical protein